MRLRVNLKEAYVWALLIVVPFLYRCWSIYEPIRVAKFLGVCFMGGVSIFVYGRDVLPLPYISFAGYFLINAVITGFGPVQQWSMINVVGALAAAIPFFYADEKTFKTALKALSIAGLGMSVYSLLQVAGIDFIFTRIPSDDPTVPVGFLGQQTLLGPFMVATFVASAYCKHYFSAILAVIVVIFTESSFSYLSLAAAVAVLNIDKLERIKLKGLAWLSAAAVTALGLVLLLKPTMLQNNGRFRLWGEIVNAVMTSDAYHVLFGFGSGSFMGLFPNVQSKSLHDLAGTFLEAHNEFVQYFFEIGLVGLVLSIWCVGDLLVRSYQVRRNSVQLAYAAILVALIANACGNFILRLQPHSLIFLIAALCILTMKRENYGSK